MARRVLLHPLFATLVTLLVIVAGMVGSIYSSEIRSSFPFYWGNGPICVQAVIFWTATVIAAFAYFLREQSVAQTQREDQRRVLYRAQRFERLIRTLPPENFLEVVADFYSAAAAATNAAFSQRVLTPHPRPIVEQSLRHLLRLIAALAQQFDGSHADVEYAANIMLFKESGNLSLAHATR
jgi:hypothetical protein